MYIEKKNYRQMNIQNVTWNWSLRGEGTDLGEAHKQRLPEYTTGIAWKKEKHQSVTRLRFGGENVNQSKKAGESGGERGNQRRQHGDA